MTSAVRVIEQLLQPFAEFRRKSCRPRIVNQSDTDEVSQVRAVLVAKCDQLEPDKCSKRRNGESRIGFDIDYVGRGGDIGRPHALVREQHANSVSHLRIRPIKEDIHARDVTIDEPRSLHRDYGTLEVVASQQNVNIPRRSDERFVHARHPQPYRVAADHGIWHARSVKSRGRATQAIFNDFLCSCHSLERKGR